MSIGRYAPSPTGTFHIGNLRTALLAWLCARQATSAFHLRWEDLDVTADPAHEETQATDLAALGIDFDGVVLRQSERLDHYRSAVSDLRAADLTYRCWCSRREIREATMAPHGVVVGYPGTCRDLSAAEVQTREDSERPAALRLRSDIAERPFVDTQAGAMIGEVDDFVLERGDGTPAYNLVVVIDDIAQRVEQVVRADDLLSSTGRQAHLYDLLRAPEPTWTHVPMCTDTHGDRLAKRDGSAGLAAWREAGGTVPGLLGQMAVTLGLAPGDRSNAAELLEDFNLDRLPGAVAMLSSDNRRLSLGV